MSKSIQKMFHSRDKEVELIQCELHIDREKNQVQNRVKKSLQFSWITIDYIC